MTMIFRWITLRHLIHERGRTLLTLLGVTLGVAVFVSIRLANTSALRSFSDTVDTIAGKANLRISADAEGFDESIFPDVLDLPGIEAAAPVIQTYARAHPGPPLSQKSATPAYSSERYKETLLMMGIDLFFEEPFARYRDGPGIRRESRDVTDIGEMERHALEFLNEDRGVAITGTLADRHNLSLGDTLTILSTGQAVPLVIRFLIESQEFQQALGGNVALVDIAVAQEIFNRIGKLDRIDLLVKPDQRERVTKRLASILPGNASVGQPAARTRQVENMVSAFGLSLTALSSIALFVALFLIFNTVSMSVLRRRREIGILRSIGVTRRQVMVQFLIEALILGVVGSLLGLVAGTLLTKLTLGSVSTTLSMLYLVAHASTLQLDAMTYVIGIILGVGITLVSAIAPAIEASRTSPSVTVRQGILLEGMHLPLKKLAIGGIALLILAAVISLWTVTNGLQWGGFVSAFLVLGGFSLLAPVFTLLCEASVGKVVRPITGIEGKLGSRYLRDAVARTSGVVAALMVAVGMLVGLDIMVGSFRQTVDLWIGQTVKGDLYVQPVGRRAGGATTWLPSEIVESARKLQGVAAVDTYRAVRTTYNDLVAFVIAVELEVQREFGGMQFLGGRPSKDVLTDAIEGDGVLISESFAYRHRIDTGGNVTLNTPTGKFSMPVAGVYYDYSTDTGAIMMDYRLYSRLWASPRTESMALYVKPGFDNDVVRNRLIEAVSNRVLLNITPNQELRERVLEVFDQTFRITYALQAIAIVVAVLGVITTLTALILQRGREIGVLRAVGALRKQVQKMVLVESGMIGLIGAALGSLCGIALSILLIFVINKQFFGWSMQMTVDPWIFIQAGVVMVLTAMLAGLAPARLAVSRVATEAMRME